MYKISCLLLIFIISFAHTQEASTKARGFETFYIPTPVDMPESYQGHDFDLPFDTSQLINSADYDLSKAQLAALSQNGFVVVPNGWDEFYQVYENGRYREMPLYITTDAVYHIYHLVFGKLLRDLEQEKFAPNLEALIIGLKQALTAQANEILAEEAMQDTFMSALAYLTVAEALIQGKEPDLDLLEADVAGNVQAELDLIYEHKSITFSPLFEYMTAYSQYTVRGHYTKGETLPRYFRTMMWLGRTNFVLDDPKNDPEHTKTKIALLLSYLLSTTQIDVAGDSQAAHELWASIYDPTAFLVGKSDDLSFWDYMPLIKRVWGNNPNPIHFADENQLESFLELAKALPAPEINSLVILETDDQEQVTKGWRFMGQRFVLDSFIFEHLVHREVKQRFLPKALDVFAVFGNEEAYVILEDMGEVDYENYSEKLALLREQVGLLSPEAWTQTLYSGWLDSLRALSTVKDKSYPNFMQQPTWTRKTLHTALGSYTELKHDTVLYSKQMMAEMGGPEEWFTPAHYVEADPLAFTKLLALVRMTYAGLEALDLLTELNLENLLELEDGVSFLLAMSLKELKGEKITLEEYERLEFMGGWMEFLTLRSTDTESGHYGNVSISEQKEQAALVTDVATGGSNVLHEAIGQVFEIYVITPSGGEGERWNEEAQSVEAYKLPTDKWQLAKGAVFSYYEFALENERLTDEAWQALIETGDLPDRPSWTNAFIVDTDDDWEATLAQEFSLIENEQLETWQWLPTDTNLPLGIAALKQRQVSNLDLARGDDAKYQEIEASGRITGYRQLYGSSDPCTSPGGLREIFSEVVLFKDTELAQQYLLDQHTERANLESTLNINPIDQAAFQVFVGGEGALKYWDNNVSNCVEKADLQAAVIVRQVRNAIIGIEVTSLDSVDRGDLEDLALQLSEEIATNLQP